MYNLELEKELKYGDKFSVKGSMDFENSGESYSIRREWVYKKDIDDSAKIEEDISMLKKDDDNNWNRINNPEKIIEELLPSGLSEYFFFDGESMIADLKVKGKESAKKLRHAMFTILDLNLIENAVTHIGKTDLKTTALGLLYLAKSGSKDVNNTEILSLKGNINQLQDRVNSLEKDIEEAKNEKKIKDEFIKDVSEHIGSFKSKRAYEKARKELIDRRNLKISESENAQVKFGDVIIESYPYFLMKTPIEKAKYKINLELDNDELPSGLTKELLTTILRDKICICGNTLSEDELKTLRLYTEKFPPYSYKEMYSKLSLKAEFWESRYSENGLDTLIESVINNNENAAKCDIEITELDNEEKNKDSDTEKLITDRRIAEERLYELSDIIDNLSKNLGEVNAKLKAAMNRYDKLTDQSDNNKAINDKIEILSQVKKRLEDKLDAVSIDYSKKLELSIQSLVDIMLNSKRSVTVSKDFTVRIVDNHDSEYKSEGQFAIVSFAYIGGIFKLLEQEVGLRGKEYPMVLDGPFSKLSSVHKSNVINTIPYFAPQIIIFSKDDLQNDFEKEKIGHIWTIISNEEKNVSELKEGFLW